MNIESILWGITGYIAFLIFQFAKPMRKSSGWDFVLQVSIFSLLSYVLSSSVVKLFDVIIFQPFPSLSYCINHTYFLLFLGIVIAIPLGLFAACLWVKMHAKISNCMLKLIGKRRELEYSDIFFAYSDNLIGKPILITLKNFKLYIGILNAATSDPNESQRFIQVTPLISGYRDKNSFQVIFTTNYIEAFEKPESYPKQEMLISISEISTITEFSNKLHEKFVNCGVTKIRFFDEL